LATLRWNVETKIFFAFQPHVVYCRVRASAS